MTQYFLKIHITLHFSEALIFRTLSSHTFLWAKLLGLRPTLLQDVASRKMFPAGNSSQLSPTRHHGGCCVLHQFGYHPDERPSCILRNDDKVIRRGMLFLLHLCFDVKFSIFGKKNSTVKTLLWKFSSTSFLLVFILILRTFNFGKFSVAKLFWNLTAKKSLPFCPFCNKMFLSFWYLNSFLPT